MTPEFIQDKIDELENLLEIIEEETILRRLNNYPIQVLIELDKGINRLKDLINILYGYTIYLEESES